MVTKLCGAGAISIALFFCLNPPALVPPMKKPPREFTPERPFYNWHSAK